MKQRVLVVAMANSVHAAGWINLARSSGRQIFLQSVYQFGPHASLNPLAEISSRREAGALPPSHVGVVTVSSADKRASLDRDQEVGYSQILSPAWPHAGISPDEILRAVDLVEPDLVHSMETQLAGYLTFEAKRRRPDGFPPWLHSNWGSDLYFFSKLAEHAEHLRRMMKSIDFYSAECSRDLEQALAMGFRGQIIGPIPNTAGLEPGTKESLSPLLPPSRRRGILIKGYHGWTGRAMTALAAVRQAKAALSGYTVHVTNPPASVSAFAELIARQDGLEIESVPWEARSGTLERLSRARVAVGIGLSDGISSSMLEAMSLGAFPIQSCTACADEWIEHGRSGFIVSPHDTREIADCIVRAVSDDDLVDEAAEINLAVVRKRWNRRLQAERIDNIYQRVASEGAITGDR